MRGWWGGGGLAGAGRRADDERRRMEMGRRRLVGYMEVAGLAQVECAWDALSVRVSRMVQIMVVERRAFRALQARSGGLRFDTAGIVVEPIKSCRAGTAPVAFPVVCFAPRIHVDDDQWACNLELQSLLSATNGESAIHSRTDTGLVCFAISGLQTSSHDDAVF